MASEVVRYTDQTQRKIMFSQALTNALQSRLSESPLLESLLFDAEDMDPFLD